MSAFQRRLAPMRAVLGRALLTAALIALAGCANVVTELSTPSAKLPTQVAPTADESVVFLSATVNASQPRRFRNAVFSRIGNDGKLTDVPMHEVSDGVSRDTALFVGVLPAGRYRLVQLNFEPNLYINFVDSSSPVADTFEVRGGGKVDLGRVVITSYGTRVLVGQSRIVPDNLQTVARLAPQFSPFLERPARGGWIAHAAAVESAETYARLHPVGAEAVRGLGNGEVAAVSRLGTLLLRGSDGQWRQIRTGGLDSLLGWTRVDTPEARLVAVGELNTIARLRNDGQFEMLSSGNLPVGNLLFIHGSDAHGWTVAHQRGSQLGIYQSSTLDRGDWKLVRTEVVDPGFWFGPSQFWAWPTPRGFSYAVTAGSIWHYDAAQMRWRETKAPAKIGSLATGAGEQVGLLTVASGGLGGIFSTAYLSPDSGVTWNEIKPPFKIKSSAVRVTGDGSWLMLEGGYSPYGLYGSSNRGESWSMYSDTIRWGHDVVVVQDVGVFNIARNLSLNGADFTEVRFSTDNGRTWRREYSTVDSAAPTLPRPQPRP